VIKSALETLEDTDETQLGDCMCFCVYGSCGLMTGRRYSGGYSVFIKMNGIFQMDKRRKE
jgi:hypothetical protein